MRIPNGANLRLRTVGNPEKQCIVLCLRFSTDTRKHADWFHESNGEIIDLVNEKNSLFQRTLADRCTGATMNKYTEVKAQLQK